MDHISKAALYIRVSTEEQAAEGQSVDAQIDTLSQFCRLYHIDIYNIYQDLGISGKETHNRPGLIRMLEDGKQLKFNMVLVWKISRLSRSLKDLLLILDEFEKSNIIFNSYSEKFDTSTPLGKMTLQLLGSIAEFERNTIIDNVKLGLHEYANKGGKTGTVLGYDHHDKQLFVNPWEAEIIKMIYQLYIVNQMSMSEIAAYLNEAGYRTKRNNCFSKDGIATILSNPVYIGINRHNIGQKDEYQTPGLHQAIIDITVWNTAQQLRGSNKKRRPSKSSKYRFLLSGKILCPNCSSPMLSFTSSTSNKNYRYYRCKGCSSLCRADLMEEAVLEYLKELMNQEKLISDVVIQSSKPKSDQQSDMKSKVLEKEIKDTQKLLDKYVLLLDREDFAASEIILDKIKNLEMTLNQKTNEQLNITNQENLTPYSSPKEDYLYSINEFLCNNDLEALKNIIDHSIDFITLSDLKTIKDINLKLHIANMNATNNALPKE